LASRGLLPEHPRPDHQIVLLMQTAATEKDIESIARELAPCHEASFAAVEALANVETEQDAREYIDQLLTNPLVVEPVRSAMVEYISAILASIAKHADSSK
jgi:hypothetical protein